MWFAMPAAMKGAALGLNFSPGGLGRKLYIDGGNGSTNLERFHALEGHRTELELAYGSPLVWEELPGKQACRVADYGDGDVAEIESHNDYIDWFFDRSSRLRSPLAAVDADPI